MSPQHMQALAKADHVRFVRAAIKRELRDCPTKQQALELCAEHLADPVIELETMSVYDLIAAGYRCGPSVALSTLRVAGISANVKIGAPGLDQGGCLTDRQRRTLTALLRSGAPTPQLRSQARKPRPAPKLTVTLPTPPAPEPEPTLAPAPEQPGPSLSRWCPVCAEFAIPMVNGTCGFCDTQIEDAA